LIHIIITVVQTVPNNFQTSDQKVYKTHIQRIFHEDCNAALLLLLAVNVHKLFYFLFSFEELSSFKSPNLFMCHSFSKYMRLTRTYNFKKVET